MGFNEINNHQSVLGNGNTGSVEPEQNRENVKKF